MRGKKARQLRRLAKVYTVGLPWTSYTEKEQTLNVIKRIGYAEKYNKKPDVGQKFARHNSVKTGRGLYLAYKEPSRLGRQGVDNGQ